MSETDKTISPFPVVLVCPVCKRPIDNFACPCGKNRIDEPKFVRH